MGVTGFNLKDMSIAGSFCQLQKFGHCYGKWWSMPLGFQFGRIFCQWSHFFSVILWGNCWNTEVTIQRHIRGWLARTKAMGFSESPWEILRIFRDPEKLEWHIVTSWLTQWIMEESTHSGAINLWQSSDSWTNIIYRDRLWTSSDLDFFFGKSLNPWLGLWECGWTVTSFLYPVLVKPL
jgi:hypothetical protein